MLGCLNAHADYKKTMTNKIFVVEYLIYYI